MQRSHEIQVNVVATPVKEATGRALMVGVFKGDDKAEIDPDILSFVDSFSDVKLSFLLESGELQGTFKEWTVLHTGPGKPFERIVLIGLGGRKKFSADRVRSAAAKAARTLRKIHVDSMAVDATSFPGIDERDVAQALIEGALMGCYRVVKRTENPKNRGAFKQIDVLIGHQEATAQVEEGVRWGRALGKATNAARDLANAPGSEMPPRGIVAEARKMSEKYGVEFEAWGEDELKKRGFGGILCVGQGSVEDSFLTIMRYNGGDKNAPYIALVGKGVSFDTGGISIKPGASMHHMKYDMHGSATVIGAMQAIADLKLPINVLALVPTAENMPSGNAYKPGDVIKMYGKKYVEVLNTDAEGRMLLADALYYACEQEPDLVIDVATLTGSIVVALGTMVSGLFSNSQFLTESIKSCGEAHSELFWPMPTWEHYDFQLRSPVADLTNVGGRAAGSCTAARFLHNFVDRPWAHLDIAGTGWIEEDSSMYVHKPYSPKRGGTGVGVRTLAELARHLVDVSGGDRKKLQSLLADKK